LYAEKLSEHICKISKVLWHEARQRHRLRMKTDMQSHMNNRIIPCSYVQ
jgi:hypothetical protein